uniref:CCHC-type domain-containing protein n=1 Tax=Oreochromis niloticus TaxID=8128 RepID=A0A669EMK6_ORENI
MSDPHAAPPAQPLKFLAQMLAEMAKMSQDQVAAQRDHLAKLQEQADRQTQLVGAAAPPKAPPLSVAMGDGDDPQIFLETFRATAEACQWPQVEWPLHLLPLLSGEAQTAALSLPPTSWSSFEDVSQAVLDRMGLTPEDHRRRFRACRLTGKDRPFAWARKLHDPAVRWLQPGSSEGETLLVDKVVLEQFVEGLPAETARWVRCHRPASLEVAMTLAEDHLAARAEEPGEGSQKPSKQAPVPAPRRRVPAPAQGERAPVLSPTNLFASFVPSQGSEMSSAAPEPWRAAQTPGQECWKCGQPEYLKRDCPLMEVGQVFRVASAPAPSPGPGGTYSIPVRTRGAIRHALVDTGCMQTLVHQSLVRPGALLEAEWVEVKCVHGDIHRYPIVPLYKAGPSWEAPPAPEIPPTGDFPVEQSRDDTQPLTR